MDIKGTVIIVDANSISSHYITIFEIMYLFQMDNKVYASNVTICNAYTG